MKPMEITFYRSKNLDESVCASVTLPATWAEIQDAKDRARFTNDREGGVFSEAGYMEMDEIEEIYAPSQASELARAEVPVVLQVRNAYSTHPELDDAPAVLLELPMDSYKMNAATGILEAGSLSDCVYTCVNCRIPQLKPLIDRAEDLEAVNEFAKALANMVGSAVLYKAILEELNPPDLESAMTLLSETEEYILDETLVTSIDYAERFLDKHRADSEEFALLAKCVDVGQLGHELLLRDNVAPTAYGFLRRKDGEPLQEMGPSLKTPKPLQQSELEQSAWPKFSEYGQ